MRHRWRPSKQELRFDKGKLKSQVNLEFYRLRKDPQYEVIIPHNYNHKHSAWYNWY